MAEWKACEVCSGVEAMPSASSVFSKAATASLGPETTQAVGVLTAAIEIEGDRSRGKRERIRSAIADLEVERPACPIGLWKSEADDEFASLQHRLLIRRVAGLLVQFGEGDLALAIGAGKPDGRIEGDQRLREITGIDGDAMRAASQNGMLAIDAVDRRTAGPRNALVAGKAYITKIGASGALKDIAGNRRHIADLRAGGKLHRLRQYGVFAANDLMIGDLRHGGEAAKAQSARFQLDG